MDKMRSTKSGNPTTTQNTQMRLPTEVQWSNCGLHTMEKNLAGNNGKIILGRGATHTVELKPSIPARTSNLIGLSDIRTIPDFWSLVDKEYKDYNAAIRTSITFAIVDVKILDRQDIRFLQLIKAKLASHR
jgi:hypothetical protein